MGEFSDRLIKAFNDSPIEDLSDEEQGRIKRISQYMISLTKKIHNDISFHWSLGKNSKCCHMRIRDKNENRGSSITVNLSEEIEKDLDEYLTNLKEMKWRK